jgi:hypothetical protein
MPAGRASVMEVELTPAVREFVSEHIDAAEQLDILLLLQREPERTWTALQVSQAIYTVPASATMRLEELVAKGFLASSGSSDPVYTYRPSNDELHSRVSELAAAYAQNRVAVIKLIFSKPPDAVESFSDAFRLRGKRD